MANKIETTNEKKKARWFVTNKQQQSHNGPNDRIQFAKLVNRKLLYVYFSNYFHTSSQDYDKASTLSTRKDYNKAQQKKKINITIHHFLAANTAIKSGGTKEAHTPKKNVLCFFKGKFNKYIFNFQNL